MGERSSDIQNGYKRVGYMSAYGHWVWYSCGSWKHVCVLFRNTFLIVHLILAQISSIQNLNLNMWYNDYSFLFIWHANTIDLAFKRKGRYPVIPYEERVLIVEAICYVDKVIPQVDMDKLSVWKKFKFNVIFSVDDWKGSESWNEYEGEFKKLSVDIVYFQYTKHTSSTILSEFISKSTDGLATRTRWVELLFSNS